MTTKKPAAVITRWYGSWADDGTPHFSIKLPGGSDSVIAHTSLRAVRFCTTGGDALSYGEAHYVWSCLSREQQRQLLIAFGYLHE